MQLVVWGSVINPYFHWHGIHINASVFIIIHFDLLGQRYVGQIVGFIDFG